jgi:hypothetical protein
MEGFLCLLTGCEIWIQNANANLTIKPARTAKWDKRARGVGLTDVYIN